MEEETTGKKRVIHDAAHDVGVNNRIRCREKVRMPGPREKRALLEEFCNERQVLFFLFRDFEKARRRFIYRQKERGFPACKVNSNGVCQQGWGIRFFHPVLVVEDQWCLIMRCAHYILETGHGGAEAWFQMEEAARWLGLGVGRIHYRLQLLLHWPLRQKGYVASGIDGQCAEKELAAGLSFASLMLAPLCVGSWVRG